MFQFISKILHPFSRYKEYGQRELKRNEKKNSKRQHPEEWVHYRAEGWVLGARLLHSSVASSLRWVVAMIRSFAPSRHPPAWRLTHTVRERSKPPPDGWIEQERKCAGRESIFRQHPFLYSLILSCRVLPPATDFFFFFFERCTRARKNCTLFATPFSSAGWLTGWLALPESAVVEPSRFKHSIFSHKKSVEFLHSNE